MGECEYKGNIQLRRYTGSPNSSGERLYLLFRNSKEKITKRILDTKQNEDDSPDDTERQRFRQ